MPGRLCSADCNAPYTSEQLLLSPASKSGQRAATAKTAHGPWEASPSRGAFCKTWSVSCHRGSSCSEATGKPRHRDAQETQSESRPVKTPARHVRGAAWESRVGAETRHGLSQVHRLHPQIQTVTRLSSCCTASRQVRGGPGQGRFPEWVMSSENSLCLSALPPPRNSKNSHCVYWQGGLA